MMERIADYVIRKVNEAGADHIFMVTGRGMLYLSDAVAKNENITGVPMFHEQGASYAAMSYAKAKESIGACLVSTGCAATNAVTGALCAYQDNLPVIFISGQHMLNETTRFTQKPIRTYGSQEADIVSIVDSITKYSVMITDPKNVVYEVEKALYIANQGRKGPVWIDIPLDIQSARIEEHELEHFQEPVEKTDNIEGDISYVVSKLNSSKRPVIVLGGGAYECKEIIAEYVEKNKIPVVSTFAGCDIYGSGNDYSVGTIGSLGTPRAGCFALQNADYVLVIGSKMCSQTIGDKPYTIAREASVTVVDIDKDEHKKEKLRFDKLIVSDAKTFLTKLTEHTIQPVYDEWVEKCLHWKEIFSIEKEEFVLPDKENQKVDLYEFAYELGKRISSKTAVITDAGLEELIIPSTIPYKDQQICLFPASQGAMGYAIPAIIGAHYAGYEEIVVVVGDGSIMMNVQELQLLQYLNIKAKIFVMNNNMYAVIRARQKDLFRTRTIGNDSTDGVPSPDFKKIADSFGLSYFKSDDISITSEVIDKTLCFDYSCICEVMTKENQRYFHTSFRKNEKGKLVRPSIEDMSPFMDRDLFIREMIVEPIEI